MNSSKNTERKQREVVRSVAGKINIFRKIQAALTIVFMIILMVGVVIASVIFIGGKDAFIVSAFVIGIGIFIIAMNMTTFRIKTSQISSSTSENPFSGTASMGTKTVREFPKTKTDLKERIKGWLGPVTCMNFNRQNYSIGIEVVAAPENTLIITQKHLIGVALVQADFDAFSKSVSLGSVLAQVATGSTSAGEQQRHLAILNLKRWKPLMESITGDKFKNFLSTHWQFGINIKEISSVVLKTGFMNPGVEIRLVDGRVLKYSTLSKSQIGHFSVALQECGIAII